MSVPEKQAFVQYFFLYALKLKACFANCCRFYLVVSGKWRTFASSSALVVELVDTPDLGSGAFGRVSSSLIRRTPEGAFVVPSFCFIRRTKKEETQRTLLVMNLLSLLLASLPLLGRLGSLENPLNVDSTPQRGASPHSRRREGLG